MGSIVEFVISIFKIIFCQFGTVFMIMNVITL